MQMADMDAWTTREAAGTDAGEPAYLLLDGVTKRYSGQQAAVDDLHLALPRGKLLGLLGPSGCGKTTTLRMIAGLLSVTSGHIRVSGDDISNKPPHQRDIGLVFQNYALFPHMSAAQNVAFGLEMRGVGKAEIQARVDEALEMVRLPGYGSRRPREMSGGQQQRVALARALVIRPRILLLDEPLSNLDAKLRDEMRLEIRDIQQRLGITTVFVTHDQVEALTMCDVVGVMAGGRLAQLGTPQDIYERPATLFVADFVGRTNVLDGQIEADGAVRLGAGLYRCDTRGLRRGKAKIVIRPHRIHVTSDRDRSLVSVVTNSAHGSVRRVTYIGDVVQYGIDIGVAELKAEVHTASGGHTVAAGDKVLCEWKPQDMIVFEGGAP
ncbi:ABC transporter ATP-binding protein [Achromobacter sp. AONIH1]|uniref:ABC transporter ATP-binding protein n=1 Tax=Achromobacter sp. AONIH1 TaxID=1758194 RepID=UPI0018F83BB8|nr:ABC transporter ATP-binding protein [Achromobacter sp. AONIH1]